MVAALQREQDEAGLTEEQRKQQRENEAFIAARNSNVERLERLLGDGVDVNCVDQKGNSLLMTAAQQGNKRIAKIVLRRGAHINHQNSAGQSVLHYCHAYSALPLAEYLQSKGADDQLVNADGLTCYEGLTLSALQQL